METKQNKTPNYEIGAEKRPLRLENGKLLLTFESHFSRGGGVVLKGSPSNEVYAILSRMLL